MVTSRMRWGVAVGVLATALAAFAGDEEPGGEKQGAVQAAPASTPPDEATFDMREICAFDIPDRDMRWRLLRGSYARCSNEPDKGVKYPELNSKQPLYGQFLFDRDYLGGTWTAIPFVLDESGDPPLEKTGELEKPAGDAKGGSLLEEFFDAFGGDSKKKDAEQSPLATAKQSSYDRLYIDINRDGDLTNDPVIVPMKDPPWRAFASHWRPKERAGFGYLELPADYGPGVGVRPFRLFPWLSVTEADGKTYSIMWFVPALAREGRIRIGSEEYDATLGLGASNRYDRGTMLYLKAVDPKNRSDAKRHPMIESLTTMRRVGDQLYTTKTTPLGDKLIASRYQGDFGVFRVGAGSRSVTPITFAGEVYSQSLCYNLDIDPTLPAEHQDKQAEFKVPVGDYLPGYMRITYGRLDFTISNNYHSDGKLQGFDRKPIFFMQIRKDKPFVLDFSNKPEILFASPARDATFKPGDEVMIKAVLIDPVCDVMIRGLRDTTQKASEAAGATDGKGQPIERPKSLDPIVTITNLAGEKMTEGTLPFG